jgi:hypothetical protein
VWQLHKVGGHQECFTYGFGFELGEEAGTVLLRSTDMNNIRLD